MTHPYTAFDRRAALDRLASEEFDVLVIGGGVTGAGVALEAAARGRRTALVERGDFASGTSSKSSKLVHGGLRYLQQHEFGLVHESLVERHRLLQNAPHLVAPLPFLIPLFGKGGVVDKAIVRSFSVALTLYDLTGGWKIGKRHKKVDAAEVSSHLPTLRTERLVSGFLYYDARTDDARLTLAVLRTAVLDHGAVAANYLPAVAMIRDGERIGGAVVADALAGGSGDEISVKAKVVVNATGVWADEVRSLDEARHPHSIRPAKGIHLTVPQSKLPCDIAAVVPVRKDGRSIFIVPWGDQTYLGTTDTDYDGPLDDPRVETADVEYILGAINAVVSRPVSAGDVTGTWAGLRPLLTQAGRKRPPNARTADLSRRHRVSVSPAGLVTITGGKLTTYRRMAEDTVDEVQRQLTGNPGAAGAAVPDASGRTGRIGPAGGSPTRRLKLRGADGTAELERDAARIARAAGLPEDVYRALLGRYGGETGAVLALGAGDPAAEDSATRGLLEPIVEGLPHIAAEVVYAARYEMAVTVEDFLSRRSRALLREAGSAGRAAQRVAELMAAELGWDRARVAMEVAAFTQTVTRTMAAPVEVASGHESPDRHELASKEAP